MKLTKKDRTIIMDVEITPNPKLLTAELKQLERIVNRLKKMGIGLKLIKE